MPTSMFVAEYAGPHPPRSLKATMEQSGVRVVSNFPQGFYGKGAERYESGETCKPTCRVKTLD